ncbi:hypothetical protein Cfla_2837 [Cellulomonas flavigena DSM 20109]|uniref:Uncharacterized protein n=1 Tax=Cellulomonas flavigena (strain ATCC 482 / DSM 20109 / BCRC 11376 / JCM 18109 / NBRC 3775 / NCIMB 8073 / NRS 134) TaxID=446466 RepID=D5UJT4_CELFN|nr:hypothetical protein [Cellulomonas flavigena]ADG75722.1 hypothetical protein Cfla_2837 [Cellulomonas flavigena DSM 20109]
MTTAPSDAPASSTPGTRPPRGGAEEVRPGARRRVAVAAGAALVVVLAVGAGVARLAGSPSDLGALPCEVFDDPGARRPPATVRDGAVLVREAAERSGARVRTTCIVPALVDGVPGTDTTDPAAWQVDADVVVDDVADMVGTAAGLLEVVRPDAPFAWNVDVQDATGDLSVALEPGGDTTRVAVAVEMRAVEGVSGVWLGPGGGRVTTLAEGLAPLLAVADGHDLPPTILVASFPWVEVWPVRPGEWPAAELVALATEIAGWDEVARTVVSPGTPLDLTVEVEEMGARADVAQRVAGLGYAGPPAAFHVSALGDAVDGVLGSPPAGTAPPGG